MSVAVNKQWPVLQNEKLVNSGVAQVKTQAVAAAHVKTSAVEAAQVKTHDVKLQRIVRDVLPKNATLMQPVLHSNLTRPLHPLQKLTNDTGQA